MPRMAERIGDASGAQVAAYVMAQPEVQQAIKSVTNAARWVSAVAEKADAILAPFADLSDKADGKGGLIRAILAAWNQAREVPDYGCCHSTQGQHEATGG